MAGSARAREVLSIDELLERAEKAARALKSEPPIAEPAEPAEPPPALAVEPELPPAQPEEETVQPPQEGGEIIGEPVAFAAPADGESPEAIWQRLLQAFSRKAYSQVTIELENLERARDLRGADNLPDYSNALLGLSRRAAAGADAEMQRRLLGAAINLSPDYPGPRFAEVNLLRADKAAFLPRWIKALAGATGQMPVRLSLVGYGYLIVGLTLAALAGLFALALCYRYLTVLAHDLGKKLGLHQLGSAGLRAATLLLLLTVLTLGWGPLAAAPVWLVVFYPYANPPERRAALLTLALLLAAPLLLARGERTLIESRAPLLQNIVRAQEAYPDRTLVDRLTDTVAAQPESELARFALALALTKQGAGERARPHWAAAAQINPKRWQSYNNAAVTWLFDGQPAQALSELDRAAAAGKSPEIFYNRALALEAAGERGEAEAALRQARALDAAKVALWDSRGREAKYPALAPLTNREVGKTLGTLSAASLGYEAELSPVLGAFGISSPTAPAAFAGAGLLFALLLSLLKKRFHPASSCERCGVPIPGAPEQSHQSRTICTQCVAAFYRKEAADPEGRMRKVAQVERYQRRKRWLLRLASLLAPGAAQLGRGRTTFGWVLLGASLAVALTMFFGSNSTAAADPHVLVEVEHWPLTFALLPLLGLLYLIGIAHNLRGEKLRS